MLLDLLIPLPRSLFNGEAGEMVLGIPQLPIAACPSCLPRSCLAQIWLQNPPLLYMSSSLLSFSPQLRQAQGTPRSRGMDVPSSSCFPWWHLEQSPPHLPAYDLSCLPGGDRKRGFDPFFVSWGTNLAALQPGER